MNRIMIFDPTARPGIARREPWRPLDTLNGKVVGFIDNSKPNFHLLADDVAELLMTRHGVSSVVRHRKLSASIPAPEAAIADVEQRVRSRYHGIRRLRRLHVVECPRQCRRGKSGA